MFFKSDIYSLVIDELVRMAHSLRRAALAFSISFIVAALIAPLVIKFLKKRKLEQVFRDQKEVRDLATLHSSKAHTPTMGGIITVIATMTGTAAVVHWNTQVIIAIFSYLLCAVLGFIDDFVKIRAKNVKGIPGRMKLLIHLIASAGIIMALRNFPALLEKYTSMQVPFTGICLVIASNILLIIFLFFVLSGTSNSVNLTDGLDGLAASCALPVLLFFAVVSMVTDNAYTATVLHCNYIPGNGELAIICAAAMGASLVFLWYNGYPAAIFMGDTGSLSLGGLIGIIAFLTNHPLHLVIAGGIFVMEALSDILQVFSFKFFDGRRIFKMAPIHHHFELSGYHEAKITLRFCFVSIFLTFLGTIGLGAFWGNG